MFVPVLEMGIIFYRFNRNGLRNAASIVNDRRVVPYAHSEVRRRAVLRYRTRGRHVIISTSSCTTAVTAVAVVRESNEPPAGRDTGNTRCTHVRRHTGDVRHYRGICGCCIQWRSVLAAAGYGNRPLYVAIVLRHRIESTAVKIAESVVFARQTGRIMATTPGSLLAYWHNKHYTDGRRER